MSNFVTIATFTHAHEFAVLKLLLEKEGIRFYFQNETMGSVVPFLGAIALKVHHDDVPEAEQILKNLDNRPQLKKV